MALRLPRLPANVDIVDKNKATLTMSTWWQAVVTQLESAINGIQAALAAAGIAQAAADTAIAAAATAQTAGDDAAAAAAAAQAQADASAAAAAAAAAQAAANAKEAALVNSYITPSSVLSATPALITIAAHVRDYADGTTASVSAGSVATVGGAAAVDYVSYSDPARAGGAVTYTASTSPPTQGNNIHVVGAVTVPASGSVSGGNGPRRPGEVIP